MPEILTLVVGPLQTNCYIVSDTASGEAAIIDPGDAAARIADTVQEHGFRVRYLFLTHGHFDHMFALPALRRLYPEAETLIHEDDGAVLTNPALARIPKSRHGEFTKPADRLMREGGRYPLGSLELCCLHTPGHTPGSCCLHCDDTLFTGDTLFRGDCGRTDLPGGDEAAMTRSLRRLYDWEGEAHVLPGHGEASDLMRERRENRWMRLSRELL